MGGCRRTLQSAARQDECCLLFVERSENHFHPVIATTSSSGLGEDLYGNECREKYQFGRKTINSKQFNLHPSDTLPSAGRLDRFAPGPPPLPDFKTEIVAKWWNTAATELCHTSTKTYLVNWFTILRSQRHNSQTIQPLYTSPHIHPFIYIPHRQQPPIHTQQLSLSFPSLNSWTAENAER